MAIKATPTGHSAGHRTSPARDLDPSGSIGLVRSPGRAYRRTVARQYDRHGAPRVTAKGRGVTAERILDTAREHGIPLEENRELAEALAKEPLVDEIPVELCKAVAQLIGFVLHAAIKSRA